MKDCLKLIKGNKALEDVFKGIDTLPIEEQRSVALSKAKEYYSSLFNELEQFKKSVNPKHKIQKFVAEDNASKIESINATYQEKINALQNETTPTKNTVTDENVQLNPESSVQQGDGDNLQNATNDGTNNSPTKQYTVSDSKNAPKYQVIFNNGPLEIKDSKGKEPSPPTRRKVLDKYADDFDFTQGKRSTEQTENIDNVEHVAKTSNNPSEIAETILNVDTQAYLDDNLDYNERIIAENIGKLDRDSFINFGDKNYINNNLARAYLKKSGTPLDTFVEELNEDFGTSLTEQDIIDFTVKNPNGPQDAYRAIRREKVDPLKEAFTLKTGLPATPKYLQKAIDQQHRKDNDFSVVDVLSDEDLITLQNEREESDKERFEADASRTNTPTRERSKKNENRPRIREEGKSDGAEQASQNSVKALTKERIKPSIQKPKNSPKKLNNIIADVSDKLKTTLVYGKTRRRGTTGTYNPSNTLVKIRRAGDLDTVAHELGHLIDDKYDIVGTTKGHINEVSLVQQLKWFSDRGGSNPPSSLSKGEKEAYLEREGLAELIRAYIANPKEAKAITPELFKHFESTIDNKTKTVLKEFSQDFLDFANASYGEQILSNVENSTLPKKEGFKKWLEQFKGEEGKLNIHWLDKVKSNWTNSMHIANKAFKFVHELKGKTTKDLKPEQNFEVMTRLLSGINGKVNNALGKGLVDAKNKTVKDSKGLVMNINYLLESLDSSSENNLRSDMDSVIKLLIAERTIEYVNKFDRTDNLTGIGGGIKTDLEVAQGYLNEFSELKKDNKEKHTRIKEAARRYREFADAGLKYAVEKGRISKEQYDKIKETNQYYVSLARTKEVTPGEEILPFLNDSNKISSVKEVIKRAKGGTDVIKNPYLSLLHNTVNFIKESDRNEVMQSFIEPLTNIRNMGDGDVIDLSQIARKVSSGEKNSIKVFKDGESQHWQFDQDIYDALKGLEGISHNKLVNILGKPADLIRFTVTNFPVFALRNAFRDTMSRLVISRTRGKVSDLIHSNKDRELFEQYGGSQAGFYLTNKDAYVEEMNNAVKKITKKGGVILDPRKLNYKNYRKLLERGENLNRVAEYKSAFRKAKKDGMDDYNAGLYAAYQARDLMDFAVAGHWMRTINKLVPFSNASVQSVKRSVKGAKENPGKFALRMALFTLGPQIVFRALVHANGDEEEYEELPDYQRDLFWNFKTPFTGDTWISLPKPFELGMPSSIIDRGISKTQGNKDAFDGSTMSSIKALFPFDETALIGSLKPIIEASSNHDFFRDRDIVPFWEKEKLMELREGTKYASRIGNVLSDGFGFVGAEVDPRKIDHIIKGYTTYYGDWVLSLGDIGKEDSRYQFNFTKTGFAKDMPISNAKSVKKVYDLAKSIGADSDKNVKFLKGLVKTYYDLEDKEAKKKLSKEIYKYAKSITPYLESKKEYKLQEAKIKKATNN